MLFSTVHHSMWTIWLKVNVQNVGRSGQDYSKGERVSSQFQLKLPVSGQAAACSEWVGELVCERVGGPVSE